MCSSGKSAKRWWRRTAGDHHHLGWRFCWRDSDSPRARTNSHPSLYRYDSRGNCIARSLPGAGWTYTVYDKGNHPILTQDAAQRAQNANYWTFALPDHLGRSALRGTVTMSVSAFSDPYKTAVVKASLPKNPTYTGTYKGYTVSGITLSSPVLLEVDYYDQYGFAGTSPFPAANNADFAYDSSIGTSFSAYYSPSAQGLQTGSLLKVLDNTAGNQYLWSVSYYDDRSRVVQNRMSTHLGGVEKDWFLYDFIGNVTKRKTEHKPSSGTSLVETTTQTYDTWDRPLVSTHQIGSGTATTVSNRAYDKAGRLATDKRNGTAALKTTFSYNIRSWVTGISGSLFSETLNYQDAPPVRWGGDVSKVSWTDGQSSNLKAYTLAYDTIGRLKTASFSDAGNASANFTEKVTQYDGNGNIKKLERYGRTGASTYGKIDDLVYTYSGNKATSIKDTGAAAYSSDFRFSNGTNNTYSYSYDAAGRMTADASKGISSITWNVLGLPQTVTFSSGAVINYSYAADGTKLREARTASSTTSTTDYTGDLVLENGTRSRLLFDGGYMSLSDNAYHYFLSDHLGSVRVVANASGTAEEYDHYYPLGGPIAKYSTATSIQPVKYQGKEWGASKGLNLYDFGARHYDPATGRWLSQDPLAEKYYSHSPYLFCAANPMRVIDPSGMDGIYITFPKYKADGYPLTGHAGVLLIDNKTGLTKYYEYGRYDSEGMVRHYSVPNVEMKDGMPTAESLNNVLTTISKNSGKGQILEGAYVKSDLFEVMNEYAKTKFSENSNINRTPYNVLTNNCGTFADEVIKQDKTIAAPFIIDPRPVSIIKEYQKKFTPISYDPGKGILIKAKEQTTSYNNQTKTTEIEQNWWQKMWYGIRK